MVFSAKTNGAEEWKAIISAISTLVEEATFEATVEGISFRGMDPSHVALIAVHHSLLPGLTQPKGDATTEPGKMSKSDPNSGIFIHNSDDEITKKIRKGWCEEGLTENNPVLELARQIVFHEYDSISIERPEKFGGNITYNSYEELEADFARSD